MRFSRIRIWATALAVSCLAGAVSAEEFRIGDFQSPTHIVSREGTTFWMKEVERLSNGEVTFDYYPSEQAAKANALLDAVTGGVLDFALVGTIYHSKELPLNSIVGLPGFYGSAVEGTKAMQSMVANGPLRDELLSAGVVPVFAFVLPPYQVLSVGKRLESIESWKNANIRTSGASQAMVARSLGAVGVSIPGPEVYTATERGRLDGILFPLASVPAYNLQEVVKHISTNGSFGGYSFVLVMRRDAFEALPEKTQQIILKAGEDAAQNVAAAQDASISGLVKEWGDSGIDMYAFTNDELAELNGRMKDVAQEWVDRIGALSPDAGAVLDQYRGFFAH